MSIIRNIAAKFAITILIVFIIFTSSARADEGMWLISLIGKNVEAMQKLGFKLTAEDIYSINKSSLKDAVVSLDDGGCTGEIISSKGLVLTNHHCGVADIQYHSSTERNLIQDGFWASNLKEELPVPGKTALILVRVEDVTPRVLPLIDTMASDDVYSSMVNEAILKIQIDIEKNEKGVHAKVVPMFNYNQYYLFVYQRFTDVRLVGAPPASIGNFGGDVDNWHWPRHTGDFCIYRIYSGTDGLPAEYSKHNIPYKPKHHFPISLKGVNEGDFTMIIGYPGTTYRYATSFQAQHARDVVAPWISEVWGNLINSLKEEMSNDVAVKVNYTDTHDMLVNFWQKDTWQAESMHRYGVVERLKAREDSLRAWATSKSYDPQRYLNAFPDVESYYTFIHGNKYEELFRALSALISWPTSVGDNINEAFDLFQVLVDSTSTPRKVKKVSKQLKKRTNEIFENYFTDVDAKLYAHAMLSAIKNIPENTDNQLLNQIKSVEALDLFLPVIVKSLFERSYFTSPERFNSMLANPSIDSLLSDHLFYLHLSFESLASQIQSELIPYNHRYQRAMRTLTHGILEMEKDKLHYPDANSTMRVSYGKVAGYKPRDGVVYRPFTYLDGIMEKDNPSQDVFKVPDKMKQLWLNKDFGQYGTDKGLPVCFISDNDITNGNSGSPVLDAQGNLIGVAFDGNREAMSCDFAFEPDYQRTIITDIRYVLFVVDKYADAKHLVDEMTIIK